MIKSLNELVEQARRTGKKRLAVAAADEVEILRAAEEARREGFAEPILVGDAPSISSACDKAGLEANNYTIVDFPNARDAAQECCRMIRRGNADLIVKGAIKTGDFMKAILDKQDGLVANDLLSHVAVFEIPDFDRLLFVTDAAINIMPTLSEKAKIIQNAVNLAHNIGYEIPRVACLAAVEVVNADKMPDTVESAALSMMSIRGQLTGCLVDGPLALDVAISAQAAEIKGLKSPVAGRADILLAPEIVSANVLYKSLTCFAKAKVAAIVTGTIAPVILTSRADDHSTKFLSIAMGVAGIKTEKRC